MFGAVGQGGRYVLVWQRRLQLIAGANVDLLRVRLYLIQRFNPDHLVDLLLDL